MLYNYPLTNTCNDSDKQASTPITTVNTKATNPQYQSHQSRLYPGKNAACKSQDTHNTNIPHQMENLPNAKTITYNIRKQKNIGNKKTIHIIHINENLAKQPYSKQGYGNIRD